MGVAEEENQFENLKLAARILDEKECFLRAIIQANGCGQNADDILHDIFLSLVTKPVPKYIKHTINSYLFRLVTNDIIDIRRKERAYRIRISNYRNYQRSIASITDIQTKLIEKETIQIIYDLINTRIPRYLRTVIYLRYKYQYTITEISEKLGIAENVVRVYLSTALRRIRVLTKMKDKDGDDSSL